MRLTQLRIEVTAIAIALGIALVFIVGMDTFGPVWIVDQTATAQELDSRATETADLQSRYGAVAANTSTDTHGAAVEPGAPLEDAMTDYERTQRRLRIGDAMFVADFVLAAAVLVAAVAWMVTR